MTLENDRGRRFKVKWAFAPTENGHLMARITDISDSISELCADVEGIQRWTRRDEKEGNAIYEGYTRLVSAKKDGADIIITLCREE